MLYRAAGVGVVWTEMSEGCSQYTFDGGTSEGRRPL